MTMQSEMTESAGRRRSVSMSFSGRNGICVSGGGVGQCVAVLTTAVRHDMDMPHVLLDSDELDEISTERRAGHPDARQTGLHSTMLI